MSEKQVYTTFEAARLCHVSPLSIINWVNAGRLNAFRTPGGHRRIRREDLARFMRDNGLPLPDELREGSGRRRVLIVDDERSICELLAGHLSTRAERPCEVATASDGFEAGRLVASFRPDVVVVDLRMPGLDGFQVCRTIKADPESSKTVVIAMTGYHSPETEARILECGAVRCFAKPVDPVELARFIDSELSETGGGRTRRGRSARARPGR
jgi:excisionase family DNA binding protein